MLRPVALGFAFAILWHPVSGRADSLPIVETACGRSDWLCFGTGSRELATTWDAPLQEWTITPIQPPDPENWRLIGVQLRANSAAGFEFVFANPGALGSASLAAGFVDPNGRQLLNMQASFDASCFVATQGTFAGQWTCAGGDSLRGGVSFGEVGDFFPLDPNLPSLEGPTTLRLEWSVSASETPVYSRLNVDSVEFSYIFASVPEPGTALLVAAGTGVLAGLRRRRV